MQISDPPRDLEAGAGLLLVVDAGSRLECVEQRLTGRLIDAALNTTSVPLSAAGATRLDSAGRTARCPHAVRVSARSSVIIARRVSTDGDSSP